MGNDKNFLCVLLVLLVFLFDGVAEILEGTGLGKGNKLIRMREWNQKQIVKSTFEAVRYQFRNVILI